VRKTEIIMNWNRYIISDPTILLGKPTIKGTRLSVEFLIGRLADGWTEQMLLENYPSLTSESLRAVFSYIQDCLKDSMMYEIPIKSAA
jgi:uncharacterized protein (DUF433 family)